MAWPLPQPAEIADRLASGFEVAFQDHPDVPAEGVDARSPTSPLTIVGGVQAGEAHGLYVHQSRIAKELFPDEAQDELPRHGDVWGVGRRPAAAAVGSVTFAGTDGLPIPSGVSAQVGGVSITTTAGGTVAGGTLTVGAQADAPGAAGNFPASTVLALTSPIAGLTTQSVSVAGEGFAGGFDQELLEDWRARILERIRKGAFYGQIGGYEGVARAVPGVAIAKEIPLYLGLGTVGVVVAMGTKMEPRAPTEDELELVQAALDLVKPVTAHMTYAVAAVLPVLDISLRIQPDTAAVRSAVEVAFSLFLAAEPGIGGTIHRSRLSEAISSASGEYAHRLDLPAADVALSPTHLAVPGEITWLPS